MAWAAGADCVLTLQYLAEFSNVTTRKAELDPRAAGRLVKNWQATFVVRATSKECLTEAIGAARRHLLVFWNAML